MRWFISIMQGDNPNTATPVVASEDPVLVQAVARALVARLGSATGREPTIQERQELLRLIDGDGE